MSENSATNALSEAKVLLIANPKSGTGSKRAYNKAISTIKQTLSEASVSGIEICQTGAPEHAIEIITDRGMELTNYSVILVMGGDGTLHEVANGLSSVIAKTKENSMVNGVVNETDTILISQLPPLAPIPTGTGNAIAVSMNLTSVKHAVQNVVHGIQGKQSTPVCILQYYPLSLLNHQDNNSLSAQTSQIDIQSQQNEQQNEPINKTFTTVIAGIQWGLPAQVDQGTEWMRFAGDARFTLGALAHISSKRDYQARIVIEVHSKLQEEANDEIRRLQEKMQAEKHKKKNTKSKIKEFVLEDDPDGEYEPICIRTGDNEYTLDGKFIMMVAWNCQAISNDFIMTPLARLSQLEAFDIMLVPSRNLNRVQMLDVMLHSDGSFLGSAAHVIKYFKATKMTVEQLEGDFLTVDGESVPVEPFVMEVAPETGVIHMVDTMTSTT